jgi:group II intron reverse transcriptase/maturase
VKVNGGAPGVDGETLEDIERQGVDNVLRDLQTQLRTRRYRSLPVRRTYIPKPGKTEKRGLGIPSIRDRIVQTAAKILLEPIFEADFADCSYGFRPKRSAHDAEERIRQLANEGRDWVVDADIRAYFDSIDQEKLLTKVRQRVSDRRILKLLRKWLKAGVMEEGKLRRETTGTPQGGVISPLLANIYLHALDRDWQQHRQRLGELVRYADDLVILSRTFPSAKQALEHLTAIFTELGLQLHPEKTRIRCLRKGQEGFDFLGFHHRKKESWRWKGRYYLQRWPCRKAMQAIRQKIKAIVGPRSQRHRAPEEVIQELNPVVRGWGTYFQKGNSSRQLNLVAEYVAEQMRLYLSKKHQRCGRNWERNSDTFLYTHLGLHRLSGTVKWYTPAKAHG